MRGRVGVVVSVLVVAGCGNGGGAGPPENHAPVADAGPDQSVSVGALVTLDGTASSDVDGDMLGFSWSLAQAPAGSTAAMIDATAVRPSFIADREGIYQIRLTVNDGRLDSADTVTVTAVHGNVPPVANAGRDQSVVTGATVALDGTASSDADGDLLAFSWSFTTLPADSTAALSGATTPRPTFTADRAGSYVIQLVVNDGIVASAPDTVTVTAATENVAPVANAGADQTVVTGSIVTLDGSASSDVDGNVLKYNWSLTWRPAGSAAVLVGATTVRPSFSADRDGDYVIQLVVDDGTVSSAPDTVTVTAAAANDVPVASAGRDQWVATGAVVTLDASASYDPDRELLAFRWSVATRPAGSTATLVDPTSPKPTFTADLDGTYVLEVVVTDAALHSASDRVMVTAAPGNAPPIANAGVDLNIKAGTSTGLNCLGSRDPENAPLTSHWSIVSKPAGSMAALSDPTACWPQLTTDLEGSYVISLVVNDGILNSTPDLVIVVAASGNSAPVLSAGPDFSPRTGFPVRWPPTYSWDADNDPLTYSWWLTARPASSNATLANATSGRPSLTPDVDGTYVLTGIASDGKANSLVDAVAITAVDSDIAPVANAGPDQTVPTGTRVQLEGWAHDADDDFPLSYTWAFVTRPPGSSATLSNVHGWWPTFVADRDGSYVLSLVVSDGWKLSEPDSVTITATYQNLAPVADAGPDLNVTTGHVVTLDASASSDINRDTLTYAWSFTSRPVGSAATLSDATSVRPTFTADADGIYELALEVSDGRLASTDSIAVATVASTSTDCTDGLRLGMTFELGSFGEAVDTHRLATNLHGGAVVVWTHTDWLSGLSSMWARRCQPGNGWTLPVRIDGGSGLVSYPDVAIDSTGNAVAVWREWDGTQYSLAASSALAAGSWQPARFIEGSTGDVTDPRVAISDAGRATALWRQWNGSVWTVVANDFAWTSGWNVEQVLSNGIESPGSQDVVMDGSGRAMVTWVYWTNPVTPTTGGMYWTLRTPTTGWTQPVRLDEAIGGMYGGAVGMNHDGAAIAVWVTQEGTSNISLMYAARYQPVAGWSAAEKVSEWCCGTGFIGPRVLVTPSGVGVIGWSELTLSPAYVAAFVASNVPPTGWTTVRPGDGYGQTMGGALYNDGGENVIAAWSTVDSSWHGTALYATPFAGDTGWQTPVLLRTLTADDDTSLTAWEPDHDLIFVRRFASTQELQASRQRWP